MFDSFFGDEPATEPGIKAACVIATVFGIATLHSLRKAAVRDAGLLEPLLRATHAGRRWEQRLIAAEDLKPNDRSGSDAP
jgi:hypothetical protein